MKKILIATLMTLTLTMALFAQRSGPSAGGERGGQPQDPSAALKATLDLTDAQVTAVKALMQTRQDRSKAIMTEVEAKRQALDTLLSAASPDPTAAGNAAIALKATEKKVQAEQTWFVAELKKLLTGSQQTTLDNLIASGTFIPGLGGPGVGRGGRGGPRGPRPGGGIR